MDIDIKDIEIFRLKDIVMEIFLSKTLITNLRPFAIEQVIPPKIAVAKQTETTQRFKAHLITSSSEDLFTKIEFSRRKMDSPIKTETIDEKILFAYKLPPLAVPHYPAEVAIVQKIGALANRAETQARDIFDIYMLLPRIEKRLTIPKGIHGAYDNVFKIDFEVFRDTVINYLGSEDQRIYGQKAVWEEIQLKVGHAIENFHHTGNT